MKEITEGSDYVKKLNFFQTSPKATVIKIICQRYRNRLVDKWYRRESL